MRKTRTLEAPGSLAGVVYFGRLGIVLYELFHQPGEISVKNSDTTALI
ncbi:hypothetical protein [Massilia frigida]|nr:hypothetical protein [Massilia frigida]